MRAWGLIFCAEMVRAFLRERGPKWQTRRTVRRANSLVDGKTASEEFWASLDLAHAYRRNGTHGLQVWSSQGTLHVITPRYQAGDVVWVREAFFGRLTLKGRPKQGEPIRYRASEDRPEWRNLWKSPRGMPRWASRIERKIAAVRVERVASISGADAQAEGVTIERRGRGARLWDLYRAAFKALWLQIHGRDAWARNEWVWVLELKKGRARRNEGER